jgi:hypothetical protein
MLRTSGVPDSASSAQPTYAFCRFHASSMRLQQWQSTPD